MPVIFLFKTYREFLKAYLKALPKQGYGESQKLAAQLRVSSTFMSQVLSGKKQLSLEHAELLRKYLGLSEIESDYLFNLILLERAGSADLENYLKRKLASLKEQSLSLAKRLEPKRVLTDEEKAVFYSTALYSSILVYSTTSPKGRTQVEIEDKFDLSRSQATEALRFLLKSGLAQETDGHYQMTTQSTHVPQGSPHLLKHHSNWRIKAIQASEKLSAQELMYTVQVSLSEEDFVQLREQMSAFIQNFLKQVHDSPAEKIANLNLDWFFIRS